MISEPDLIILGSLKEQVKEVRQQMVRHTARTLVDRRSAFVLLAICASMPPGERL
jgi:hypothetical protein